MTPSIVALIPARAGSQRVPGKNTRLLGGKPLIQWTIEAAKASGVFSQIAVCADSQRLDLSFGVTWITREAVPDDQPDIVWVSDALTRTVPSDAFAILRPTSPFRTAETIRRAWDLFKTSSYDSIRAVEPVRQHPGKMWTLDTSVYGGRLEPFCDAVLDGVPWHSRPTQTLPTFYVQNASLEMAWTRVVTEQGTIAGAKIGPFFTEGFEGFDINTEDDFTRADSIASALVTT